MSPGPPSPAPHPAPGHHDWIMLENSLLVWLGCLASIARLLELGQERVDPRAGDDRVLLAAAAADADAADHLLVDDDGHPPQERRDLAAASEGGVLQAEVEEGVGFLGAGGDRPGRGAEGRGGD